VDDFFRPGGTGRAGLMAPTDESVGYFRASRWDLEEWAEYFGGLRGVCRLPSRREVFSPSAQGMMLQAGFNEESFVSMRFLRVSHSASFIESIGCLLSEM
jgi:hypothetical protein